LVLLALSVQWVQWVPSELLVPLAQLVLLALSVQ
jgi:hypothetical protein